MQSLYAQYIKEREGKQILEVEGGFAVYSFLEDGSVYLSDIYVEPTSRNKGLATSLASSVEKEAVGRGSKAIYGSVAPKARGSTDSLKVLLANGYQLDSATSELIAFKKVLS